MKISFSIELTRQPSVKKLVQQLDRMTDQVIKEMEVMHSPAEYAQEYPNTADEAASASEPTRTRIPVIDGNEPVVKPPTKQQQRRANEKKGLGLLTDDEVREQRNEARRAKRAANKAAATTTTTTTQPGQTQLV